MTNKHLVLVEILKNYQLYSTPLLNQDESGNSLKLLFKTHACSICSREKSSLTRLCLYGCLVHVSCRNAPLGHGSAQGCPLSLSFPQNGILIETCVFLIREGHTPVLLIDNHTTVDIYYVGDVRWNLHWSGFAKLECGDVGSHLSCFNWKMNRKNTHFSYLKIHSLSGVI